MARARKDEDEFFQAVPHDETVKVRQTEVYFWKQPKHYEGRLSSDAHSFSLSCAAAQTCSTGTASQLQCCLWPAWFSRSCGVGTGHGLGHQELPTGPASPAAPLTRLSRSPSCLSRVAAFRRRFWTLCTLRSGLRGPSCHGVRVQL